jgi:hypothetical protein
MKVAARKLKVSESVIAGWLKRGTGKAQFERMVCLSNMSEVPLSMLARRLGPLGTLRRFKNSGFQ